MGCECVYSYRWNICRIGDFIFRSFVWKNGILIVKLCVAGASAALSIYTVDAVCIQCLLVHAHMGPCYIFRRWNIIFYLCRSASARACICQNAPFSTPNSARHRKNIHHFWFCNLMWVHVSLAEYFSLFGFAPCILPHFQCTVYGWTWITNNQTAKRCVVDS